MTHTFNPDIRSDNTGNIYQTTQNVSPQSSEKKDTASSVHKPKVSVSQNGRLPAQSSFNTTRSYY